jgi:adenylyltransferase/sulfurtransferase
MNSSTRYARHISLPEVGEAGQGQLADASVLVVGAGGLGSPLLLYLAAAGVGTLGLVDHDRVALSNLQRQILYETGDVDRLKTHAAQDRLQELNPDVTLKLYPEKLTEQNAADIIQRYDLVADGCDNFATRLLVNATCYRLQKILVSAAVMGMRGQLYSFKAHLGAPHPCYQCLCPEEPPADALPDCSNSGILGSLAGMVGSMQATEVIKEILTIGPSLSGKMVLIDALQATSRTITLPRDPDCKICGKTNQHKPEL